MLLALLPVCLLAVLSYRITSRSVRELVNQANESAAMLTSRMLSHEFASAETAARMAARMPPVQEVFERQDAGRARALLEPMVHELPDVDRISLLDRRGVLWGAFPHVAHTVGMNFSHREHFRGVMESGSTYISGVFLRASHPQELVVAVATPVRGDGGEILGTLVAQYPLRRLTQWIDELDVGRSGQLVLIDPNGIVAAHPAMNLGMQLHDEYAKVPQVRDALSGRAVRGRYVDPVAGREMIAQFHPVQIGLCNWAVIAQQPLSAAYAPVRELAVQIAVTTLLLGGVALGLALLVGRMAESKRRLSVALQNRGEQLQASNRELEAFSYSVSHDLRAPLRAISGFSEVLMRQHASNLPAEARHYLERINAQAVRMTRLIEDLLALSRFGRQELARRSVETAQLVRQVIEELAVEREGRVVRFDIGRLPACRADPTLLRQVFLNLLSNAQKYTRGREVALIEIASVDRGGRTLYYVKDNGVGFDMRYAGKLFGVFQRLHIADEFEGTGVGLAIVQRIIRRHGGEVWAESEIGKGATFFFTLGADVGSDA